ncbi:MAG TPA: GntR family transcriptional regulator [Sphingomicrobium sp.]|nr:GntR family transcriptional regulator [Sphingomicrobium sp.]
MTAPGPSPAPQTPLSQRLAAQIAQIIRSENIAAGARLTERSLAERLRVSRSPVRAALRHLETIEVVSSAGNRGFVVSNPSKSAMLLEADGAHEEETYLAIARDRLEGRVPDRVTENELMRRYGLSRSQLTRMLHRIAGEGWVERLPGHGWEFLPMLTSLQSYRDSYRFRLIIEPAAILEPNFVVDRPGLERCRDQQRKLIAGDIWTISGAALFQLNRALHETIIECSQNPFFIESLRRVDHLRRLFEYKVALDRKRAAHACREHITLVDLLLDDQREEASAFMRRHLSSVSAAKTRGDAI